jgi:hypothetical protein
MSSINNKLPSFKEFYLIEEGIGSSIIEKFRDLKKEIMTKDIDGNPINTKKIHSLEQEIMELLKALARLNKDVFRKFAQMVVGDRMIKINKKVGGLRLGFWVSAILHLMAFYGLKTIHDTKEQRYEKQGMSAEYQQATQNQ